jgi:murein DD-endopeptidase MepM/ murein hydrolase activator NlpD
MAGFLGFFLAVAFAAQEPVPPADPGFRVVDLDIGEPAPVALPDGRTVTVKLAALKEFRCPMRDAVRRAEVSVEIDGERADLTCATYTLPKTVGGVQVDCPVTRGYTEASSKDNVWALDRTARLRIWPAGSPWLRPGTFDYPVDQRWFASDTQMGNEPCYVNACDVPGQKKIYYHYGLDFGGTEGLVSVLAATDGVVVSKAGKVLEGKHPPLVQPRYDVVYLLDARGWYYRYSHMASIEPSLELGKRVAMGTKLGTLGKEGGSGGWSHLHFDVAMPQPSGRYGITDAYAFAFEAYLRRHKPALLAVARPHLVAWTGQAVTLEGGRSWHSGGPDRIKAFRWRFSDGTEAEGASVRRSYARPGHYTEVLTVVDDGGRSDVDFAVVQVFDPEKPVPVPPALHVASWPTMGLRAGQEVTFKARTFGVRPDEGSEAWDFGDGSEPAQTRSDGNKDHHAKEGYAVATHRYAKPGRYIVTVRRTDERGLTATGRIWIAVEP